MGSVLWWGLASCQASLRRTENTLLMDRSNPAKGGLSALFPHAEQYPSRLHHPGNKVREPGSSFSAGFPFSERHVQAAWYDPEFRPAHLITTTGEPLIVEQPGRWNLEAGPDFLGAVLRVGREQRRVEGDVEIHIRASGWQQHGHGTDPNYDRVCCHITYFPGELPAEDLPPGCLQANLMEPLQAHPAFSFDALDVAAYPYAVRAETPPCSRVLRNWSREERQALLQAAGEERLRRKSHLFAQRIEAWGIDQALYGDVMMALGYAKNKVGFRGLALRVPHAEVRSLAGQDAIAAYAILLGVAGLLPSQASRRWDDTTREFIRDLWHVWWKHQSRFEERVLPPNTWNLNNLRPHNHPRRRLMAAAHLFTRTESLHETWTSWARQSATDCVRQIVTQLTAAPPGYWSNRLSFAGNIQANPIALLGQARANTVLANVLTPYLATVHRCSPAANGILAVLPSEESNAILREAAFYLFGPDHTTELYSSEVRRQGLLQIFHDFCLHDRSHCAACRFPTWLESGRPSPLESAADD